MIGAKGRGDEHARRAGHRFNIIVKTIPKNEDEALPMESIHALVIKRGYGSGIDELAMDIGALVKRGEVSFSLMSGAAVYWATEKGLFEARKRVALMKLHNADISENDLVELERLAKREKIRVE
jgi:hypothetical protein